MKKADIILTVSLLLAALLLGGFLLFGREQGQTVEVHIDGKLYTTVMLSQPQTITIDEKSAHCVIEIEDGSVRMISSDCPDQLCVHQGAIHKAGESIICLPQRIVIEIKGKVQGYDILIK